MRGMMSSLKLTVNESKTRVCRLPAETFDFLGYTIGRCYRPKTGTCYLGHEPSVKRGIRLKREISEATGSRRVWVAVEEQVARLNRLLTGWSNYFCIGPVTPAYRDRGLPRAGAAASVALPEARRREPGAYRFPDRYLYEKLGLVRLWRRTKGFPWAKG